MTDVAGSRALAGGRGPSAGDAEAHVPGGTDIWVFVLVEMLIFGSYFVAYMLYRCADPAGFLRSQENLNQDLGVLNTIILLTSSLLIARCVQAARAGRYDTAKLQALLTMVCGALFVALKIVEWTAKVRQGFMFSTNSFFSFYYFLTAIHVLHVLIGFVVLGLVVREIDQPARRSQKAIEAGATYWHMVDFLWVFIFALVYVMR